MKISRKGTNTRVLAKNILPGDEFVMRGQDNAIVLSSNTYITGRNAGTTVIVMRMANGGLLTKQVSMNHRMMVRETPASRASRRRFIRINKNKRPTYMNVRKMFN